MSVAVVTGAAGLVGSETVRFLASSGMQVVGIDNYMRRVFFGENASTRWQREKLEAEIPSYVHYESDVRDSDAMAGIFARYGKSIEVVVHTAAQPSHEWATGNPEMDFAINANGTLNLLEVTRRSVREAVFIFTSTNKVYGDLPNGLPLIELETRWDLPREHPYYRGIPESMSIDGSLHSLFGASKVAADVLVQEYGRYYGMRTVCFRCGCLTGPNHTGAQLHGFLSYLAQCVFEGIPYTILGYKGKQVRDNIHSSDLVRAFWEFFKSPRGGEVYNIGGGRHSNCSILEAIDICEQITDRKLKWDYVENNRRGDHTWWISDNSRFSSHYPEWRLEYDIPAILREIIELNRDRWKRA